MTTRMPPSPFLQSVAPLPADQLAVARPDELQTVAATASADGDFIQSSDGGTGVQPFVPAEAVGEVPAPRNISGKQEGQTGIGSWDLSQTPGSPMLSARTLPNPSGQAPGPSEAFPSSPALVVSSLNSGESDPSVMPDYGAGDAFRVPPGYVLIPQPNFDRMMELIIELQAEREADRIDHADYERLREKERVELLTPPPSFLKRSDFARAMERDAA